MSLRYFSKISFICNIFFLLALILRYRLYVTQQDIVSHIVLLGWIISPLINILFVSWWILGKKDKTDFSVIIGWANVLFLLVQMYLFFTLR